MCSRYDFVVIAFLDTGNLRDKSILKIFVTNIINVMNTIFLCNNIRFRLIIFEYLFLWFNLYNNAEEIKIVFLIVSLAV